MCLEHLRFSYILFVLKRNLLKMSRFQDLGYRSQKEPVKAHESNCHYKI